MRGTHYTPHINVNIRKSRSFVPLWLCNLWSRLRMILNWLLSFLFRYRNAFVAHASKCKIFLWGCEVYHKFRNMNLWVELRFLLLNQFTLERRCKCPDVSVFNVFFAISSASLRTASTSTSVNVVTCATSSEKLRWSTLFPPVGCACTTIFPFKFPTIPLRSFSV